MPLLHAVEQQLARAWPPAAWQNVTVLAAVSGGPDSVALLRALAALKTAGEGRLVAAHVNHQLRGGQSAADEAFVIELCRRLDIPCEVRRIAVAQTADASGEGIEAAARRARYEFFAWAAGRLGARYVVTGHTADDQAETILHHILRGTGLRGLAGMARARPLGPATLLRPLLGFRRAELRVYLDDLRQPCCRDESNEDLQFTRNRIRNELLPRLAEEFNSGIVEAIVRLGTLAGEAREVLDTLVDDLAEKHVRRDGPDAVTIETAGLAGQPRYLVRELIMLVWRRQGWPMQAMGFAEWDLLAEMICGGAGVGRKKVLPGNVLAESAASGLRLSRG